MKPTGMIKMAVLCILLLPGISMADSWKNESGKGAPEKQGYRHGGHDRGRSPDNREQSHHDRGHDRVERHRGYHDYRGYRERPYDRGRHYGHYKHNKHRYEYHGHWRSWDEWDRYARRYPHLRRHGHYYRDHGHLMFRFCDPAGGPCFFFSIGG